MHFIECVAFGFYVFNLVLFSALTFVPSQLSLTFLSRFGGVYVVVVVVRERASANVSVSTHDER